MQCSTQNRNDGSVGLPEQAALLPVVHVVPLGFKPSNPDGSEAEWVDVRTRGHLFADDTIVCVCMIVSAQPNCTHC
jgi:hypothetical protein